MERHYRSGVQALGSFRYVYFHLKVDVGIRHSSLPALECRGNPTTSPMRRAVHRVAARKSLVGGRTILPEYVWLVWCVESAVIDTYARFVQNVGPAFFCKSPSQKPIGSTTYSLQPGPLLRSVPLWMFMGIV